MKNVHIRRLVALSGAAACLAGCVGDADDFSPSETAECTSADDCASAGAPVCRQGTCVPADVATDCSPDDSDDDGDGVCNSDDNCISAPNPDQADSDEDGQGDACDDSDDLCPQELSCVDCQDAGCHWTGGMCAADCIDGEPCFGPDADGCPVDPPCPDGEEDGFCGDDRDGDGVRDEEDNCPGTPNEDQADANANGEGDACEGIAPGCELGDDTDNDGACNSDDNCPDTVNPDQADHDGDGIGDLCDEDVLFDCLACVDSGLNWSAGVCSDTCVTEDACYGPETGLECLQPPCPDDDEDGVCDDVDPDVDADGTPNGDDNCPLNPNPEQDDSDGDGLGDACDDELNVDCVACLDLGLNFSDGVCAEECTPGAASCSGPATGDACPAMTCSDQDFDGVCDASDNCPSDSNAGQLDTNGDGVGDACESSGAQCSSGAECPHGVCVELSELYIGCAIVRFCTLECQLPADCPAGDGPAQCLTVQTTGEQVCVYEAWTQAAGCN